MLAGIALFRAVIVVMALLNLGCYLAATLSDLLEEAILIVYNKIESYDINYCDKQGNPHPVKFVSYIWKRIDGFIIDYLKEEMKSRALYKDIMDLTQTEENPQFYA